MSRRAQRPGTAGLDAADSRGTRGTREGRGAAWAWGAEKQRGRPRRAGGAFTALLEELSRVGRKFGTGSHIETRGLNKSFFPRGCPWGGHLPRGARYLAIGLNDPASGIHAPNESVPMWTFAVHAAQLDAVMQWVDATARRES